MKFFASKSGPERVRSAARRDGRVYNQKTAAELSALIEGPITDELVDLLFHLGEGGPYYKVARDALDGCGHPKAVARLLDRIDRGRDWEDVDSAAACFRHPLNATAAGVVEKLAQIANGSHRFAAVRGAVHALGLIGSAQALETLRRFSEQTARELYYDHYVDEDNGDTTIIHRSSAFLGQRPDAAQRAEAEAVLRRANPFLFGSPTEAEHRLRDCLAEPESGWQLREQLRVALVEGFSLPRSLRYDKERLAPIALEEAVDAARASWPSRLEHLRAILAEEETSRLEVHLVNGLARGDQSRLPFYQALPRKRPISELPGLDHPFTTLGEVEEFAAAAPRRRALAQIAEARARPDDMEFRLSALGKTYALLPAEMRPTVVNEFIAPLLADTRWASRRNAIKALASLPLEEAAPLLRRFLESGETDVELLSYARDALERKADPKLD